ncbi:hypothetical protein AWJ20_895 [Sugiyamaella lignohabitans]|uniref:Uncharacterized protein n=1 Tax=Sugiyamaella lignohabitans TaxID=796027 RepID=A0A167D983_9ASCO|nr:uncharacterized protein AWJ20_895 [Sugiyamaella lignohabitans]ANB12635.1 hypothetical protein AWJ20_895 [Sugiyamaella lignohabitans]
MSQDHQNPITVSLKDLRDNNVSDSLLVDAFGRESLGIIIVTDLPDHYKQLRARVLQNAAKLAHLAPEKLAKIEVPEAFWLVGWSCGKEKLANGLPDNYKGSYYVNCDFYAEKSGQKPEFTAQDLANCKEYTSNNVFPDDSDIPRFEQDLKDLLTLMIDTAKQVAKNCDRYLTNNKQATGQAAAVNSNNYLENIVKTSNTTKARLLHYYAPPADAAPESDDSWCGEHVDHSCITALTSEYLIQNGNTSNEVTLPASEQHKYGLFIRDRQGSPLRVEIPKDALAFQTGSALEAISGGVFRAIPHYVKAPSSPEIARSTLAVFCQPSLHDKVSVDKDFVTFSREILSKNH